MFYPQGETFFFLSFHCHYYHYCYSLYCVLSFKSLAILSVQKKNYIFRILFKKKKRIYSIFNQKSFKGMCCFFRTTVTSFCVKSHSRNSHFCVEEPVRSRAALLILTETISIPVEHMKSRRICPDTGQILGIIIFLLLAVTALVAAVMFVDMRPVLCQALCCLLIFKMAVIRSDVQPGGMSCYFSPLLHINSLDACCL